MNELLTFARDVPNRGRTHIFLGHPLADGCDKTTVEPGNTYSPGAWTCGVSIWVSVEGAFHSPDVLADGTIEWTLIAQPGDPPIAEATYPAGPLRVRHRLTHLGGEGSVGVDFSVIEITCSQGASMMCAIVVKDVGPAGGRIAGIDWIAAESALVVNQSLRLECESPPGDVLLLPADERHDSPVAALAFAAEVTPDRPFRLGFRTVHGFAGRPMGNAVPADRPHARLSSEAAIEQVASNWRSDLPARVFAPNERIATAWERCAYHILAAMELGLPRIGAVNYPLLWMRDCVLVLRSLDLIGRSDLARVGNDYLAPMCFSGGFGAEADAPGEGIWALVSHAHITGDWNWAGEVFPHIRKRVDWIIRMLEATGPIRFVTENRAATTRNTPAGSVVCLAAENGLIHGRMDWHWPDFYINCWAVAGLRLAAEAATRLGEASLSQQWLRRAQDVDYAIAAHLLSDYGNDRDPIVTPHPTGALFRHHDALRRQFERWYRAKRLSPDGSRLPERLWTYFEVAQAHNAMLLGLREEAWVNLRGLLAPTGCWDTSAFIEGRPDGLENLPFETGRDRRGWLDRQRALGGNMPHNWTSSEMLCLIRDVFVIEEAGGLTLGAGVPREWMAPGSRFGVRGLPTDCGAVSYAVTIDPDGQPQIDYHGPRPFRLALPHA